MDLFHQHLEEVLLKSDKMDGETKVLVIGYLEAMINDVGAEGAMTEMYQDLLNECPALVKAENRRDLLNSPCSLEWFKKMIDELTDMVISTKVAGEANEMESEALRQRPEADTSEMPVQPDESNPIDTITYYVYLFLLIAILTFFVWRYLTKSETKTPSSASRTAKRKGQKC